MKKFGNLIMLGSIMCAFAITGCGGGGGNNNGGDDGGDTDTKHTYTNGTYENCIYPLAGTGEFKGEVADPHIARSEDGYFYLFATGGAMFRSEDCCTWEKLENVIPRPTWGDSYYAGKTPQIWAPDVLKVKDKWIYYYSLSAWDGPCGIGYAVSDNLGGPYTDMGKLVNQTEIDIQNLIDPCMFIDDDGAVYMCAGSFQGQFLFRLTDDGMGLLGGAAQQKADKILISGRVGGWDGSTYEGSYIIKKGEWYYYFGSTGSCCENKSSNYQVRVGKSKEIEGPYIDSNGNKLTNSGGGTTYGDMVVWAGSQSDKPYAGPGHNSILKDDKGVYWIIYHSYVDKDNFATRHLMMDKLNWDEKTGMPYVETKKPSYGEELDGPSILVE